MNPAALELVGMVKRYGSTTVLDNLSLRVDRGELLVVLGESGSGKSTMIQLIAGLDKAQAGVIRIAGNDQLNVAAHRRDLAVVFQSGNGYDHLTVQKNLELAAQHENAKQRTSYWIERLELGRVLSQKLSQLSGGETQRVAIARAMLSGKSIVLLDEPLTHLNRSLREEVRDLLVTVHRESKLTFVYVTHDSEEAFFMASRLAVLADGKIQQTETARSVYHSPANKAVARLLGQPTIDMVTIPQSWLVTSRSDSAPDFECGVRCGDWVVTRITHEMPPDVETRKHSLTWRDSFLIVQGAIGSCRWMGDKWLLEVQCNPRIRIAVDSRCDEETERVLLEAERKSKDTGHSKAVGFVEAKLALSKVRIFQ